MAPEAVVYTKAVVFRRRASFCGQLTLKSSSGQGQPAWRPTAFLNMKIETVF